MVTLYNVIDTRTNQYHSVAVVKERNVKWFVPQPIQESPVVEPVPEPESEPVPESPEATEEVFGFPVGDTTSEETPAEEN